MCLTSEGIKRVFAGVALALAIAVAIGLWLALDTIQMDEPAEETTITVAPRPTRR